MFEFIEKAKIGIKQKREEMTLQAEKDKEIRELRRVKEHDKQKTELEREAELETIRAEIRKKQSISPQKAGNNAQQKSAFGKFQDFATDFANNQSKAKSMVGDFNFGGLNGNNKIRKSKYHKKNS